MFPLRDGTSTQACGWPPPALSSHHSGSRRGSRPDACWSYRILGDPPCCAWRLRLEVCWVALGSRLILPHGSFLRLNGLFRHHLAVRRNFWALPFLGAPLGEPSLCLTDHDETLLEYIILMPGIQCVTASRRKSFMVPTQTGAKNRRVEGRKTELEPILLLSLSCGLNLNEKLHVHTNSNGVKAVIRSGCSLCPAHLY